MVAVPKRTAGLGGESLTISIGLGEYRVGRPEAIEWVMHGLGSCIGLIIVDRYTRISAAAHVVLPQVLPRGGQQHAKYGETVVPFLIEEMQGLGARRSGMFAQMVGGSAMFRLTGVDDIGQRNAQAVRQGLTKEKILLIAEDIGGQSGRTLRWQPLLGCARVTRVGMDDQVLTPAGYQFTPIEASNTVSG